MLHFRTTLLILAFVLLLLQNFVSLESDLVLALILRLAPTALLLLWFILTIFFRETLKIDPSQTPRIVMHLIRIIRPIAGLCIITGAIFKLMHWIGANMLLLNGIGAMAIYSLILSLYAKVSHAGNPDIIDDQEDQ